MSVAVVPEMSWAQWHPGGLVQMGGVLRGQKGSNNDHGLRDVIIFVVLHKDHRGLLTTYEPSEHNMELSTPMNHQQISGQSVQIGAS